MNNHFEQARDAALRWARQAQAAGWLTAEDVESLNSLESRTPALLFDSTTHRPLVVAFFGGTGVGKSSLLNRLAGQAVARTGVERPTSREISLYLHESLDLARLSDRFPLDRIRSARHGNEANRQILWIDMPDMDSTETANRDQVTGWLPHVDVLVYVVSPERYRDDRGWRLLSTHSRDHAWLFVMNHWDRGDPVQLEDFRGLLAQGGFAEPILLRTDCRSPSERDGTDDFEQLETLIRSLADHHIIEQLESRAQQQRHEELRNTLACCLQRLGSKERFRSLRENWELSWHSTQTVLMQGMSWPIREVARAYVQHETNPLLKRIRLDSPAEPDVPNRDPANDSIIWDDWAQMQLQDTLDRLILDAQEDRSLPPLRNALQQCAGQARRIVHSQAQLGLRQALANPGNVLQRAFLRLSAASALLLPLGAIGWVSYQVTNGFYESARSHIGYLGTDFAIHSGLLIAIAWLLPYFLNRQLRPSAERAAAKGLRAGVAAGLAQIGIEVVQAIDAVESEWRDRIETGKALIERDHSAERDPDPYHPEILRRVLPSARGAS